MNRTGEFLPLPPEIWIDLFDILGKLVLACLFAHKF